MQRTKRWCCLGTISCSAIVSQLGAAAVRAVASPLARCIMLGGDEDCQLAIDATHFATGPDYGPYNSKRCSWCEFRTSCLLCQGKDPAAPHRRSPGGCRSGRRRRRSGRRAAVGPGAAGQRPAVAAGPQRAAAHAGRALGAAEGRGASLVSLGSYMSCRQ